MKDIELLLTENVDNLGIVGDVVEVKAGYARNYLLPFGLATTPTQGAIKRLEQRRKEVQEEMARRRTELEKMIETLADLEITIERSANEQGVLFGGVSQPDIAQALRERGFEIEDRAIRIGEQIKRLDSYEIPIQFDTELKTQIKLWVVSDQPAEGTEDQEPDETAQEQAMSEVLDENIDTAAQAVAAAEAKVEAKEKAKADKKNQNEEA